MSHFISCTAVSLNVLWLFFFFRNYNIYSLLRKSLTTVSFPAYYAEALRQKPSSRLATKKTNKKTLNQPKKKTSVLFYEGHLLNWHARATESFLLFVSIDAATDKSVGQYSSCTSKHAQLLAACFVNVLKKNLFAHSLGSVDGKQKKWPGLGQTTLFQKNDVAINVIVIDSAWNASEGELQRGVNFFCC